MEETFSVTWGYSYDGKSCANPLVTRMPFHVAPQISKMRCETAPNKYTAITCPVLGGIAIPGLIFFTLGGAIALQLDHNYGSCRGRNPESALLGEKREIYKGF